MHRGPPRTELARIGLTTSQSVPVPWLAPKASSTDTTFVDATTKLFSGQFSRSDYRDYLASFYPGGTSQATLDCIYTQL